MKNILYIVLLFCSIGASAQNWHTNFAEAEAEAKKNDKPIVLVFSGSDWCAPCIKLDKDIWQSEEFKKYATGHYILYKADFPRRKTNKLSDEKEKENKILAEKYNRKGYFPLVLVLNAEGKVLGETGYKKVTPAAYISSLNSFLN
tara:strand:+ start:1003 stop:1437 length:435 start_codon:yes stop_codon:yes gene_type:complete